MALLNEHSEPLDLQILGSTDSANEELFAGLAEIAAEVCGTPTAFLSLFADGNARLISKTGIDLMEFTSANFLSAEVFNKNELLVVPDVLTDSRFASHLLNASENMLFRFYAAAPISTASGAAHGALCVIDRVPRRLNETQIKTLEVLARQAGNLLESLEQAGRLARDNAELTANAENHRILIESTSDVIMTIDESGTIQFANAAVERVFGYRSEEMIGKRLEMIFPERLRAAHHAGFSRYLKSGRKNIPWSGVRISALDRSGEEIQIEISFGEYHKDQKRLFTAVIRDITERLRVEESLRKSEEYRNLFRHANDAILILDPENETVLDANERACEIYGFARENFLGVTIKDLSEDGARGEQQIRQLFEEGTSTEFETIQFGADGTPVNFLINSSVIEFEGKSAILSINRDITERKKLEIFKGESDKRFQGAFNFAPIGMALVAQNGQWLQVNRSLCEIVGYSEAELLATDFQAITHPDDLSSDLDNIRQMLDGSIQTYQMEKRYLHKAGHVVWVVLSVSLVRDEKLKPLYFIFQIQNITKRKRAEEELQQNLSLLNSTLEATADGILAVNQEGRVILSNHKFVEMWNLPDDYFHHSDSGLPPERVVSQLKDPQTFARNVHRIALESEGDSFEVFELKDGRTFERHSKPQKLNDQICGRVFSFRDVTERRRAEDQLIHNALHDQLTGLPNRVLFLEHLRHAIERAAGSRGKKAFAVLFLDFDHFKVINDSLGHMEGDLLLQLIAQRLTRSMRTGDIVARLGGDEFTVLLDELDLLDDALQFVKRIQSDLMLPFDLSGREVAISASIGISMSDKNYRKPEEMLRDADIAMYRAKAKGKARYQVFSQSMHEQANSRLQMEIELRRAIENKEFSVYYQPIVDLHTKGAIIGFEALVRWHHPERGLISPVDFIPLAEETGLILPLGGWVLAESCRQMRIWLEENPTRAALSVSVNLSSKQFSQPDLVEQITCILAETKLPPHCLKLEITESHLMENSSAATDLMRRLRSLGVQLSLDDFGTGYSSLSYLHRVPADFLKIDRSFVSRMTNSEENYEIVHTIIKLAQNLKMKVIAEGIETEQQLAQLQRLGCEYGQGYFFSKPLEARAAGRLIKDEQTDSPHHNQPYVSLEIVG